MPMEKLYSVNTSNALYHYGIKDMHWGVRRYQNLDGTLTEEGKKRYYKSVIRTYRENDYRSQATAIRNSLDKEIGGDVGKSKARLKAVKEIRNLATEELNRDAMKKATTPKQWVNEDKKKTALTIGTIAGVSAAAKAAGAPSIGVGLPIISKMAGAEAAKAAIATLGPTVAASSLAGVTAFTVGSIAAAYVIEKYGDTDVRDLFKRR